METYSTRGIPEEYSVNSDNIKKIYKVIDSLNTAKIEARLMSKANGLEASLAECQCQCSDCSDCSPCTDCGGDDCYDCSSQCGPSDCTDPN